MNDRICPICGFSEKKYNADKSEYAHLYWATTDEGFHYTIKSQSYVRDAHICPMCGVVQVMQPDNMSPRQPPRRK